MLLLLIQLVNYTYNEDNDEIVIDTNNKGSQQPHNNLHESGKQRYFCTCLKTYNVKKQICRSVAHLILVLAFLQFVLALR